MKKDEKRRRELLIVMITVISIREFFLYFLSRPSVGVNEY